MFAAFVLTSLAIEITPGPNMAYLAVLSVLRGRRAGLAAVAGIALGLLSLGLVAGLGFGSLIAETPWLYEALRWGGVAFLVYLAWDSYRESRRPLAVDDAGGKLGQFFSRGLITNILNPKAALFYVSVLPNFMDPSGAQPGQALTLTLVYVTIATAIHTTIAIGASVVQRPLSSNRFRQWAGFVAAIMLVAIAVWLGFATQRS